MNQHQALRVHAESIVIDGLNASYFFNDAVLRRIRQGGITAFNGTVAAWHSLPETMNLIGDYYRLFEERRIGSCRCGPWKTSTKPRPEPVQAWFSASRTPTP
jgi:hypothetical protein